MRLPQLCKHKTTGLYYIRIRGEQHYLGRDKRKAETERNRLLREKSAEIGTKRNNTTLGELLQDYSTWIRKNKARSTYLNRSPILDALTESPLGDRLAEEIKPIEIDRWIDEQPTVKSPTTKCDRIVLFSGAYRWGMSMGLVRTNPLDGMKKPQRRVRQFFLPPERFSEFIAALPDCVRDFVIVMLESGMRAMEMFRVEAQHFDGEKLTWIIEDSKGEKHSRVVFLPDRALKIVARLAAATPEGPIFLNSEGRPFDKDSINCHMTRLKKKFGQGLCATALRHSFAHWCLTVGGYDMATVAKFMGHRSTTMIYKRYGHLDGSKFLAEQAKKINMQLDPDPVPAA